MGLNHSKITKVLIGAGLAGGGAAIAYILDWANALNIVDGSNWYAPLVVAGCSVLLNILRKFASK